MGLSDLRRKLTASVEQLDDLRLQARFEGVEYASICDAEPRVPARVGGEIQGMQVVPRAGSPSLEVTVSDGTGRAVAVFTGTKRLGGMDPGRAVVLEGVGRAERGRLVFMNPAYTLMP